MEPVDDALIFDREQVIGYIERAWPPAHRHYAEGLIELRPRYCRFQRTTSERHSRPGGTMAGPLLMTAVDQGAYALVLGHLGDAALAVTSHLSIEFLRRPPIGTLIVDTRLRKLGRTQITTTADLWVDEVDPDRPVAVATTVYSRALVG